MKIDISSIDKTSFKLKEGILNDKLVYLINPVEFNCKWTGDNLCFRSMLIDYDGNVISRGFNKFFNATEKPGLYPDPEKYNDWVLTSKEDGCCDESTSLTTEDGNKTIKEICDTKYNGKVLAFDVLSQCEVWADIEGYSVKSNNNDWYEIELENGFKIKLTGAHRVWLPELNCYREVKDLTENDIFLLKK